MSPVLLHGVQFDIRSRKSRRWDLGSPDLMKIPSLSVLTLNVDETHTCYCCAHCSIIKNIFPGFSSQERML